MGICKQLVQAMQTQAEDKILENPTFGLGYTAEFTDDGTAPMNSEATLRAVRQAKGTPVIQKFSQKTLLVVD